MLIPAHPPLLAAAHRAIVSSLAELVDFVEDDSIPAVTRAYALCVGYGWTSTPIRSLDRGHWVRLFSQFGFITNQPDVARPRGRIRLFRAATAEFAHGLSWSDSRAYAERYLTRRPAAGPHYLYVCLVEPEWVLALVQRSGRDGRPRAVEWIVDVPTHARIETVNTGPATGV